MDGQSLSAVKAKVNLTHVDSAEVLLTEGKEENTRSPTTLFNCDNIEKKKTSSIEKL